MQEIRLKHGQISLVDDEDFEYLNQFNWRLHTTGGYAVRTICVDGKWKSERMHRLILNAPNDVIIDHIDRNRLNNQRNNLRFCSHSQNSNNSKKQKDTICKYKGVYRNKSRNNLYYKGQVVVNGKQICKNFPFTPEGEIQAALWYNEVAKVHFGEFAFQNEIILETCPI